MSREGIERQVSAQTAWPGKTNMEATMTNAQARKVFDRVISAHRKSGDLDQAARMELAREYFTNETFRLAFADYLYSQNQD